MILFIKICDEDPECFDVTCESFDNVLVDIRKFVLWSYDMCYAYKLDLIHEYFFFVQIVKAKGPVTNIHLSSPIAF